jgi:serine/threonine-protein kinase
MDDLTGRTIGPYELRDRIGTGGMATVYRAVHRALGQPRAVKVLLPTHASDPTLVARFDAEAKLAASLRHPNIVPIYDVGEEGGHYYLVMDFVVGVPLGRLIEQEGALPIDRAVSLLRQLALALDYAHGRGVIHRDVKAGNVLVGPDDHVTLFDFGIARSLELGRLTKPGLMVGTPHYLAPEVISGADGDRRSDLYSLGVLAFEMLAGRLPFTGSDTLAVLYAQVNTSPPLLRDVNPEVTAAVEQVVGRQLSKRPDDRYPTATAFVSALSDAAHGLLLLPGEGTVERLGGPAVHNGPAPARPTTSMSPTAPLPGRPADDFNRDPITPTTLYQQRVSDDDTPTPLPLPRPTLIAESRTTVLSDAPTGALPPGLIPARRGVVVSPVPRRRPGLLVLAGVVVLALIAVGVLTLRQSDTETAAEPTVTAGAVAKAPTATTGPAAKAPTATALPAAAPAAAAPAATAAAPAPAPTTASAAAPTVAPTQPPAPTPAPTVAAVEVPTPSPEQQLATALAAIDRGDFPSAFSLLAGLLQLSPPPDGLDEARYRAHLGYGQQLLEQGQLDESAGQFDEALNVRPDDPAALEGQKQVTLAKLWQTMEAAWDQDEAIVSAALEEILALDPGYRDASLKLYALLVARGERLLAEGDTDGAIAAFQRAAQVYPDGPEAQARLAALTAPPAPEAAAPAPPPPAAAPAQQQAPAPAAAPASGQQPAVQPPINPSSIQPPPGLPALPPAPAGLPGIPGR